MPKSDKKYVGYNLNPQKNSRYKNPRTKPNWVSATKVASLGQEFGALLTPRDSNQALKLSKKATLDKPVRTYNYLKPTLASKMWASEKTTPQIKTKANGSGDQGTSEAAGSSKGRGKNSGKSQGAHGSCQKKSKDKPLESARSGRGYVIPHLKGRLQKVKPRELAMDFRKWKEMKDKRILGEEEAEQVKQRVKREARELRRQTEQTRADILNLPRDDLREYLDAQGISAMLNNAMAMYVQGTEEGVEEFDRVSDYLHEIGLYPSLRYNRDGEFRMKIKYMGEIETEDSEQDEADAKARSTKKEQASPTKSETAIELGNPIEIPPSRPKSTQEAKSSKSEEECSKPSVSEVVEKFGGFDIGDYDFDDDEDGPFSPITMESLLSLEAYGETIKTLWTQHMREMPDEEIESEYEDCSDEDEVLVGDQAQEK